MLVGIDGDWDVRYGTITMKNRMCIIDQNVLECAIMFYEHQMKRRMNSFHVRVLWKMIQTCQFYLVVGWVVLFHNIIMDYGRSKFLHGSKLWKCIVDPHLVDLQDITHIFFEHSSLGSKIHEVEKELFI
jgi:hypothetical protein